MSTAPTWLTKRDLAARGIAKPTKLFHLVKSGGFPAPLYINGRAVWPQTEIDSWMFQQEARARAERDQRALEAQRCATRARAGLKGRKAAA